MPFELTVYHLPLVVLFVVIIITMAFAYRQRKTPGAVPFLFFMASGAMWALVYFMVLGTTDEAMKIGWFLLAQPVVAFPSFLWMWLVFVMLGKEHLLRSGWFIAVVLLSVFTVLMEFVGTGWLLPRMDVHVDYINGVGVVRSTPLAVFWISTLAVYLFLVYTFLLLLRSIRESAGILRRQLIAVGLAMLVPLAVNTLDLSGISPFAPIDITVYSFIPAGILLGWAIFRYNFLDLMPIAHSQVFASMGEGLLVTDINHKIVDINPSALMLLVPTGQFAKAALIGAPVDRILAFYPDWLMTYQSALPKTLSMNLEMGSEIYDVNISPIMKNGSLIGRLALIQNITEQQRQQEQQTYLMLARERGEMMTRFVMNASHDLRTPLSVINTSNYLIERRTQIEADSISSANPKTAFFEFVKTRINAISESTKRLEIIVNSMLEVAQLETPDAFSLHPSHLNLLLQREIETMRPHFNAKNQTLTVSLDEHTPRIQIDPQRISQAFFCLLDNACIYTPNGGSIGVQSQVKADKVFIAVKDTGIGIPADMLEDIFTHFYRADIARSTSTGGAGLGLAIAKRIAHAHHGEIRVESTVSSGSIFTLVLPIVPV